MIKKIRHKVVELEFEKILSFLYSSPYPINDRNFFARIFTFISQRRKRFLAKDADNLKRVCSEEYDELSKRLDLSKFQESCAVRNVLKTRRLANLLINDKGELNFALLTKVIHLISQHLYFLGPERQHDSVRQEHLLKALKVLNEDKDVQRQLHIIQKPYSNKIAEQLIIATLQLPEKTTLTNAHARRAALSAFLCYLRQNIGSCFATAPCLIIHDEQPLRFLLDIDELLTTGRLKRTWGGAEYSVPLSPSWGSGDLKKVISTSLANLSLSPGLIAACEVVGLVDAEAKLDAKSLKLKALVQEIIKVQDENFIFYISAEQLLKVILLKYFNISAKDLEDYQQKTSGLMQSSLMFQVPQAGSSKGQACANFLLHYDKAKEAFKALADNALLKAWEFTVASFAEDKAGFTQWNLYASLGLEPQEKGGIGQCLHAFLQKKLEETQAKMQNLEEEHAQIYAQVKYLEGRMQHASEKEAAWLKAEYQSKRNEFYTFEDLKNKTHRKASRYASLFNLIIQYYTELFPKYFQEVYDADMHDFTSSPYDDSPAGFRLLYKFGRNNPASWMRIYEPSQFIDSLASFFSTTESEIASSAELEGMKDEYAEMVTAIISHVRTQEFLETSFHRMAAAHHSRIVPSPLEHLDQIEKKPWCYTSGGSMETLVATYFRRDSKPVKISRWIESPVEFLVFLTDIMKQSPPSISERFLKDNTKLMLMHSPTHAFGFRPGLSPFKEAWANDAFTYTWIRDNLIAPMSNFIERIRLNNEMLDYLVDSISQGLPARYRHSFRKKFTGLPAPMKTVDFRNYLLEQIQQERGLGAQERAALSSDVIDGTLYSLLPLFSLEELEERVKNVFKELKDIIFIDENKFPLQACLRALIKSSPKTKVVTSQALQDICKAIVCLYLDRTCCSIDYHRRVIQAVQKLGYAMPSSIFFADTNWVKDYFAFVVNPGNGSLELWRVDVLGSTGYPMSLWEHWLNGSQRQSQWGVYPRPYEYTF
ncbi:hypothetical protein NEOC84_000885|nr:hypothetical protein [Neochlamydia sp. AcF84]